MSWNIKWGGQSRLTKIEAAVRRHDPDLIVLGEYQPLGSRALLESLGGDWPFQVLTDPQPKFGGLAILSRMELERVQLGTELEPFSTRILPVRLPEEDLTVVGLYGLLHKEPHKEYWEGVLAFLGGRADGSTVVMGDFNTGASLLDSPDRNFFCSLYFGRLPDLGYQDLWRAQHGPDRVEHTWHGRVNGFRLDHAFGSKALASRVTSCRYDHAVREENVSDHSALVVELHH